MKAVALIGAVLFMVSPLTLQDACAQPQSTPNLQSSPASNDTTIYHIGQGRSRANLRAPGKCAHNDGSDPDCPCTIGKRIDNIPTCK